MVVCASCAKVVNKHFCMHSSYISLVITPGMTKLEALYLLVPCLSDCHTCASLQRLMYLLLFSKVLIDIAVSGWHYVPMGACLYTILTSAETAVSRWHHVPICPCLYTILTGAETAVSGWHHVSYWCLQYLLVSRPQSLGCTIFPVSASQ